MCKLNSNSSALFIPDLFIVAENVRKIAQRHIIGYMQDEGGEILCSFIAPRNVCAVVIHADFLIPSQMR